MRNSGSKKIFGIGLGRTATTSLGMGLSIFGFKTRHFPANMYEIDDADASVDISLLYYLDEVLKKYPDAYYINTVRDIDSWLASCKKWFTPDRTAQMEFFLPFRLKVYGSKFFDEEIFRQTYYTHQAKILELKHKYKILDLDIIGGQSWPELCQFLDIKQPIVPFPTANSSKNISFELREKIQTAYKQFLNKQFNQGQSIIAQILTNPEINNDPDSHVYSMQMSCNAYIQTGEIESATKLAVLCNDLYPDDPRSLLIVADTTSLTDIEKAKSLYETYVDRFITNKFKNFKSQWTYTQEDLAVKPCLILGKIHLMQKDKAQAKKYLKLAESLSYNNQTKKEIEELMPKSFWIF